MFIKVASLASESARAFQRRHLHLRFDLKWHSVDFGGELSAFDAGIIVSFSTPMSVLNGCVFLESTNNVC